MITMLTHHKLKTILIKLFQLNIQMSLNIIQMIQLIQNRVVQNKEQANQVNLDQMVYNYQFYSQVL